MSEPGAPILPPPPPVPPAPAAGTGFFTRMEEKILPHAEHLEADVAHVIADAGTAIQDHAGTVYDVSGDVLALLRMIDPADAPLAAAAEALLPKVFAMVAKATALAQSAQKGA